MKNLINKLSDEAKLWFGGMFIGLVVGLLAGGFTVAAIMGYVIMQIK